MTHDPSAPLSWRDVYRAVNESESRIVKAIQDSVQPIADKQADHESRLRAIETGDLIWLRQRDSESANIHTEQGKRIGTIEERVAATERIVDAFSSRERGILGTLSVGQKVILTLAAIVGAVVGFMSLLTVFADAIRGGAA